MSDEIARVAGGHLGNVTARFGITYVVLVARKLPCGTHW